MTANQKKLTKAPSNRKAVSLPAKGIAKLADDATKGLREAAAAEAEVEALGADYAKAETAYGTAQEMRCGWADRLHEGLYVTKVLAKLPRPDGEEGTVTQAQLAAMLTKAAGQEVSEARIAIAIQTGLCRHFALREDLPMPEALEVGKKLTTKIVGQEGKALGIKKLATTTEGQGLLLERLRQWAAKVEGTESATAKPMPQLEAAREVLREATEGTEGSGSPERKFGKLLSV